MKRKVDLSMWFGSIKNKGWSENKLYIAIALLVICAVMWVLNFLTPRYGDDYWYPYMFIDDFFDINRPIESFKDILISQYNHYFGFNGRSIIHIIVQLFAGILGKPVFNVFNAIAFVVFVYLLTRMTSKMNVINILFGCAVVFLFYPQFNLTVLWMSGSVNYLWTSIVVCIYILLFEHLQTTELKAKHFVWLVPCIIAGWTHEGITFPLAVSLVIYAVLNYKKVCHRAVLPLIIGLIIGALFCAFAPSTLGRSGLMKDNILWLFKIYVGMNLCVKLKSFWVLFIILLIIFIKKKEFLIWFKRFYMDNIILWNAMILSFIVIFFSGCSFTRVVIGVELFSMMLLLRIISSFDCLAVNILKSACSLFVVWMYGLVVFYSIQNDKVISQVVADESDIFIIEEINPPKYLEQYIVKICYFDYINTCRFYYDLNLFIATAYNRSRMMFFPKSIYYDIVNDSGRSRDIGKQKDYPFYIVPISDNVNVEEIEPVFILEHTDYNSLPFYIRPFAHKLDRYTATEMPVNRLLYEIIDIREKKYMLVDRSEYKMIEGRIKDIVLNTKK